MNSCRYENPLLCIYHRRINKSSTHLHFNIKTRNIKRKLDYKPPTCTSDTFPLQRLLIFRCFALTCSVFTPNQELHRKPAGMCWSVRCAVLCQVAETRGWQPPHDLERGNQSVQWKSSPCMVRHWFLENIFTHLSSGCSLVSWRQPNNLVWFSQKVTWFGVGWTNTPNAPKIQEKGQTSLLGGPINQTKKKHSRRLSHTSPVRYDKQKAKMPVDSLARVCDTDLCSYAIFLMMTLQQSWRNGDLLEWGNFLHLQPQLRRFVSRCFPSLCRE